MRMPPRPPSFSDLVGKLLPRDLGHLVAEVGQPTVRGRYLHWDELRNRPAPHGLTTEAWWLGLKFRRMAQFKRIPLADASGQLFGFGNPEEAQALLHDITQRASGSMGAADQVTNPETRNRYLIRNLMEEGVTSSLIEGASTTRRKAKELLRSGREPRNTDERMVVNNYMAMQFILDQGRTSLTPELVLQLHEILTRDTLDRPEASGRFRTADERVDVFDPTDNEVMHEPPPADQLPERMRAMCRFANGETPDGFVHPVVRSILLHFWLAYDHPFVDGNGRTARALFYWSMLRHNYWLCQFISISTIILRAPVQYARAFLYSETDDNDLTYFLLHQLNVVEKSLDELHKYIDMKVNERREIELRLRLAAELNDRQLDLIGHALRHPDAQYDIRQHQGRHGVVYQTARTDLLDLAAKELFLKRKIGRKWCFSPSPDLDKRVRSGEAKP